MIYAALPGRSTDQLKSSKEVVIDDQTIKLDFVSTNTNQVIEQFISKTKNQKEVTVLSSTPFDLGLDLKNFEKHFVKKCIQKARKKFAKKKIGKIFQIQTQILNCQN